MTFHLPCTDPQFLMHVYTHLLETQREHPLVQLFDLENEARLSLLFDVSRLQDSFSFRALSRARHLSLGLIDEKGEFNKELLQKIIVLLEKSRYLFFPFGLNDGKICEHFLDVLHALNSEEIFKSLRRFQEPLAHKWAERLIFETLGIPAIGSPTKTQIRAAVLCACLTPLRQNVGSCFATAPAKLIQSGQLPLFLDDLYQLLSTGKLKRTFGGVEYAIPLSPSTGIGDLKKNLADAGLQVGLCPGLVAALQIAGVEAIPAATAEDLIHTALLKKYSLTEEDFGKKRSLEMAQLKSTRLSAPAVLEHIFSFQQKEKECRAAFKGVCDNALLKAWEYTLASFSEVKMEFSRWNLYSSLGLASDEPGGIGEVIYQRIDEKVAEFNQKIKEYQAQYELAFDQVRATEALLRNVSSDSEARRLQAEYQIRAHHMRSCLEMRDEVYAKGSNYSNLLSFLVKQYDEKFPEYFQEIYDAEMQGLSGSIYDDSPAGFRLVYKHGRIDPSLWTLIYDADQYIDALFDFFSATETSIAAACEWEGGQQEILQLTSAILIHIRTPLFLETALRRMAKAHAAPVVKSPLANLQKLEKKPWAYTSGGTMTTLLKTYYCRESELTCEEKWVESESELLIFILDTLKNLPPRITNASKAMLMASPTHAFVLLPQQEGFRAGWQEDIFTYTWVRDEVFLPSQKFYADMKLNSAQQMVLFNKFCEGLSPLLSHGLGQFYNPKEKKVTTIQWRNEILELLLHHSKGAKKQSLADALDAVLFQNLPVVEGREWKVIARRVLSDLMSEKVEQVFCLFPDVPAPFMTAREVQEAIKGCYLLALGTSFLPFDLDLYVAEHARRVGLAQPHPLLFADTNWSGNYFGFIVNPGTGRLELWRLDRTLSQGKPMSDWKPFLNGSDRKAWSIYTRPYEYELGSPQQLRR